VPDGSPSGSTQDITISADIIAAALRNIYQRDFNPTEDIEPTMFNAIAEKLTKAVNTSFPSSNLSLGEDPMLHALRHSADVFAAFKVHRAQNDMAARLLDSNGNLKPFEQWAKEVMPIASHQCGAWLKTEYNTAVLRARQAANWQQFLQEKDVFPNLKWLPSTSPHPGADHKPFWNTILPIDHPFWDQHRPGDRWNCKCDLTSTDAPTTPEPKAPVPDGSPSGNNPQRGLKGNPGKTKAIFSDDHPYFPKDCRHCVFYDPSIKARLTHAFTAKAKDCYNCPYINGCISRIALNGYKLEKSFKNGGKLYVHPDVDKDKPDYKPMKKICTYFAKEGHEVKMTPRKHYRDPEYDNIYAALIGTVYYRKCPDFQVDGKFYEFEGFEKPWNRRKIKNMLSHGMKQSPYIVIDNTRGCTDRIIRAAILNKLKSDNKVLKEVFIYEKGRIRLFFRDGVFIKNNGG